MVKNRRFENNEKLSTFGVRYFQCLLLFFGVALGYAMRVNLSLAIVAMTDNKSANPDFQEYDWSEKIKSLLLSSFFWGYVVTQIPGGYLSRRFGGKPVILIGLTINSVMSIVTPLCADIGDWRLLIVVRVIQGLSQGVLMPSIHTLLSKWAPEAERAIMGNYCLCGSQFGSVIMLSTSGFIATSSLGWPKIFHISGSLGLVWCIVWYIWGTSSPSVHKTISLAERNFIENSISNGKKALTEKQQKSLSLSWFALLTSPPFWALLISQSFFMYCVWTLLIEIPAYMKNILNFNIKSNALLTALPFLMMLVLSFIFASWAACMQKRKWFTLTQSRKLFNTLATWVPAAALVILGYIDTNLTYLAVVLLNVAVGFGSASHCGLMINHIDLSPNFAGILFGITNMAANFMSILAPLAVGFFITDEKDPTQWRIVFLVTGGLTFFGNLLFIIFGSAEVQTWNESEPATAVEWKPIKKETAEKV